MLELSAEYIAGLFDGEGHVSITWSRGNPKLCVKLTNTYLPVLEAVQGIYGGTFYANKKQKAHYLQCYALSLTVEQSKRFLRELLPFLVIKKRQAKLALLFSETVYKRGKKPITPEEKALRLYCMEEVAKEKQISFIQHRQLIPDNVCNNYVPSTKETTND